MCGIFALLGPSDDGGAVKKGFDAIAARGPDSSRMSTVGGVTLGFHRLRINGMTEAGDQPFENEAGSRIVCNGEIFNHVALRLGGDDDDDGGGGSDCAVVLPLYERYVLEAGLEKGAARVCTALDAEFAFVIHDKAREVVVAARDPYGVRPLFWGKAAGAGTWMWASEMKALHGMADEGNLWPFLPGHVMIVCARSGAMLSYARYDAQEPVPQQETREYDEKASLTEIRRLVTEAVEKRVEVSERGVCALLSGGLDSSLVAALAARCLARSGRVLHTYSVGMPGSTDLAYAKVVAAHIGSVHTSILLSEEDFLEAISETVRVIESYDTTSVRASVGNFLVAQFIRRNSDHVVVLNGDYSDEVCGGYKYMALAPGVDEFAAECKRLVDDIYLFDSLRSDRTICSQGLEARTPFADKSFVAYYMGLPPAARMAGGGRMEKWLLRAAFDGEDLLPESVLWRKKEAFSDGVSAPENSWHRILAAHIESVVSDAEFAARAERFPFNTPQLKETYYYRSLFEGFYPGRAGVIPYYWLPRFCGEMKDPSAREI